MKKEVRNVLRAFAIFTLFLGLSSAQAMGSKLPCGAREGLSVAERVRDCDAGPKKLSTGQTFSLAAQFLGQDGKGSEFLRDDWSGLVWSPEASNKHMKWEEAMKYCASLTDLDLKWRLPTKTEFLKAGDKDNKVDKYGAWNSQPLIEALNMTETYKEYWTSSPYVLIVRVFNGSYSSDIYSPQLFVASRVRCVGR